MTTSTLTQLPLMAGSVLVAHFGRGAKWALARYMKTPAASTGVLALVTMAALASSNALYFQNGVHPSPFFAGDRAVPRAVTLSPEAAPMPAPAAMREQAAQSEPAYVAPEVTGSVASVPEAVPNQPVGNAEVFAVQKKLAELRLFEGKVDGYYGPMTARAIRAFEERNGFSPLGALSPEIVSAILRSDTSGRAAAPASPQPQAVVIAPVQPAPAPVQIAVAAAPVQQAQPVQQVQQDQLVARLPALSPVEQAVDTVGTAAASTIDSIVAAVDGRRGSAEPIANPPIPSATLPTQAMPQPVVQQATTVLPAVTQVPTNPQRAARPATDRELVSEIQRGLASLGFFRGAIDGNPGPETARAIREFENFHRYKSTGQVQPDLIDLLRKAGATI